MFIFMAISVSIFAQEFTAKANKSSFGISQGDKAAGDITIEGETFGIFSTNSGAKYIKAVSPKTGNIYPIWVGTETGDQFEGEPIRVSKNGNFFVLVLSTKSGNPYLKWLEVKS